MAHEIDKHNCTTARFDTTVTLRLTQKQSSTALPEVCKGWQGISDFRVRRMLARRFFAVSLP